MAILRVHIYRVSEANMNRKLAFLSILLASTLAFNTVSASRLLWIEVVPLSDEYRKLPVKVYWKPSKTCPADFNEVLKKTLDTAIILLRKSVWRFLEENDGRFDEMVKFRIQYTQNPEEAQIIVTGDRLEDGVAGATVITMTDEGMIPQTEIIYDCNVVLKPMAPAFNIVLHELLHGLGLGHAYFHKVGDQWEIMAEEKREGEPTIYVSTLDLYALDRLWFKGSRDNRIILPDYLEFKEVRPYVVELEELKRVYEELHEKYAVLEKDVAELKTVLELVEKRVSSIKTEVTSLQTEVENLQTDLSDVREELGETGKRLERLSGRVSEQEGEITRLWQQVSYHGGKITELGKQVDVISGNLQDLSLQLQLLRYQLDKTERILSALVISFIAVTAILICVAIYYIAKLKELKK